MINLSKELIPFRQNNKWGFCDRNKKIIIECKYDSFDKQSSNPFFSDDIALVKLNDKYGFIDEKGEVIIPFMYDAANSSRDSVVFVMKEGISGLLDKYGTEIIQFTNFNLSGFGEGYIIASNLSASAKPNTGAIDLKRNLVVPFIYDSLGKCGNYFIGSRYFDERCYNHQDFLLDINGVLIDTEFTHCKYHFLGGDFFKVDRYDKCAIFNAKSGELLTDFIYDYIYDFENGMAKVKLEKKIGFVNELGELIIPILYDYVSDFKDGLCCVQLNQKYGYIDTFGNLIIDFIYETNADFVNGVAIQFKNAKNCLIDKTGKIFNNLPYNHFITPSNDFFSTINYGFSKITDLNFGANYNGIIDYKGMVCVPPNKYFDVRNQCGDFFEVYNDMKDFIGYVDTSGNEYWS
jgi:hypothetical protein